MWCRCITTPGKEPSYAPLYHLLSCYIIDSCWSLPREHKVQQLVRWDVEEPQTSDSESGDEGEGHVLNRRNNKEGVSHASSKQTDYANWRILSIGNWFTLIHAFMVVGVMHWCRALPPRTSPALRQIKFIRPSFLSVAPSISLIVSLLTNCVWVSVCVSGCMFVWVCV